MLNSNFSSKYCFKCFYSILTISFFVIFVLENSLAENLQSKKTNKHSTAKSHATYKLSKPSEKKSSAEKKVEIKKEISSEEKKPVVAPAKTSPHKNSIPITRKLWQGITTQDLEILKKISLSLDHQNYSEALQYAAQINGDQVETSPAIADRTVFVEAVKEIVLWNKFSRKIDASKTSFSDISRFALDNPFYPNIDELRRNVEKVAIANNISYQSSEQYFNANPAISTESQLFLIESKINFLQRAKISEDKKDEERKEIRDSIVNLWLKTNFSAEEEAVFLQKYRNQLGEIDHIHRIERLLWDGKTVEARRIFTFVNDDYQKLFLAIIEMQNLPRNIDKIIYSVPRKLRDNEVLTYRRVLWYRSKDKIDDLVDLMLDLPKSSQFSDKWWSLRRLYGREMMKQKKYKIAYTLIRSHNLPTTSSDFWEAEWTSGWIALRFLDRPKEAYAHFENLQKNVLQPVTISRAVYWLGMAAQAAGDKNKAIEWYKTAAKYPTFFYGQLAIHKHRMIDSLGAQNDIILPKDPEITFADMHKIANSKAAQVAYLLAITGDKQNSSKIFEWLVNNSPTEGQIAVVMKIVNEMNDRELDAKISRLAAKKNVFFIKDKFQIVKEVEKDEYAPLVHAIIKQESGFAPSAVSKVGALGFMQIMPDTAKLLAKESGIRYDKHKLAVDINYNIKLGSYYIKKLIDRFDGSEMLAIASYNAGPNATQRWINEFYDPRKEKDLDKVVDWIELITYSETRNYVERIMENLIVYKYLMSRANYDAVQ